MAEKSEQDGQAIDLFGEPWRPIKDRRGRKKRKFLDQDYEKVQELVAADMSQVDIAAVMGCDVKTLTKYFSRELDEGALRLRAEVMATLRERMRDGNVAAAKALLQVLDKGDAKPAPRRAAAPKAEPLGKKAQLKRDAGAVGDHPGWSSLLN